MNPVKLFTDEKLSSVVYVTKNSAIIVLYSLINSSFHTLSWSINLKVELQIHQWDRRGNSPTKNWRAHRWPEVTPSRQFGFWYYDWTNTRFLRHSLGFRLGMGRRFYLHDALSRLSMHLTHGEFVFGRSSSLNLGRLEEFLLQDTHKQKFLCIEYFFNNFIAFI